MVCVGYQIELEKNSEFSLFLRKIKDLVNNFLYSTFIYCDDSHINLWVFTVVYSFFIALKSLKVLTKVLETSYKLNACIKHYLR